MPKVIQLGDDTTGGPSPGLSDSKAHSLPIRVYARESNGRTVTHYLDNRGKNKLLSEVVVPSYSPPSDV